MLRLVSLAYRGRSVAHLSTSGEFDIAVFARPVRHGDPVATASDSLILFTERDAVVTTI